MSNRKITMFAIILFVIFCNQAVARIGETPQKCEERYGKPLDKEDELVSYEKSGLLIFIEFYNGKAEMISFRKIKENNLGITKELSDNEIQILLKANGGKRVWEKRDIYFSRKDWQTEDGEIFAHYTTTQNTFFITTKEYLNRKEAEEKAKEEKKLEDF